MSHVLYILTLLGLYEGLILNFHQIVRTTEYFLCVRAVKV